MSNSTTTEKLERCYGTIKKDKIRFYICHILSYILALANFLLYLLYMVSPKLIALSDKQLTKEVKKFRHFVFDESFISNLYFLKDYIKPEKEIFSQIIIPTLYFIINFFVASFIVYAVLWLLFKPIKTKKKLKINYEELGNPIEFDISFVVGSVIFIGILIPILYFVGLGFLMKPYGTGEILSFLIGPRIFLLIPLDIAMWIMSVVILFAVKLMVLLYDDLFFISKGKCLEYLRNSDGYKEYWGKPKERDSEATQSSGCTYGVSVDPAFTAALKSSFGNSSSSQGSSSSYDGDAYGMGDPNYNPVSGNGM